MLAHVVAMLRTARDAHALFKRRRVRTNVRHNHGRITAALELFAAVFGQYAVQTVGTAIRVNVGDRTCMPAHVNVRLTADMIARKFVKVEAPAHYCPRICGLVGIPPANQATPIPYPLQPEIRLGVKRRFRPTLPQPAARHSSSGVRCSAAPKHPCFDHVASRPCPYSARAAAR
jgi:hypothetical protein